MLYEVKELADIRSGAEKRTEDAITNITCSIEGARMRYVNLQELNTDDAEGRIKPRESWRCRTGVLFVDQLRGPITNLPRVFEVPCGWITSGSLFLAYYLRSTLHYTLAMFITIKMSVTTVVISGISNYPIWIVHN